MIHNHHQNTRFRSLTDRLCCIVVKETKIFFNLALNYIKRIIQDNYDVYSISEGLSTNLQNLDALACSSSVLLESIWN